MQNRKPFLIIVLALVIVVMCACSNSDTQLNVSEENKQSQEKNKEVIKEENSTLGNSSEKTNHPNDDGENSVNDSEDEAVSTLGNGKNETKESKKNQYVQKLEETKKETEQLEALDNSTYALIEMENKRWKIWDDLLNEIYGVLIEQLPQNEMDVLREEQLKWIKYRDENALKASKKYEGGTIENLEYVSVLANLTEERCYELVNNYMD